MTGCASGVAPTDPRVWCDGFAAVPVPGGYGTGAHGRLRLVRPHGEQAAAAGQAYWIAKVTTSRASISSVPGSI
jgi:hypothetical protein